MAQVAFVFDIPAYASANLGDFVALGYEFAKRINQDFPIGRVHFQNATKSDSRLVPDAYAELTTTPSNPVSSRTGKKTNTSATIAGAAAGNHTVTGIKTTDELVSVVHVDDTTHAGTDKTSEYTISAADTINNTSGTSSASNHVVVSWRRV